MTELTLMLFIAFFSGAMMAAFIADHELDKILRTFDQDALTNDLTEEDTDVLRSIQKLKEKKLL